MMDLSTSPRISRSPTKSCFDGMPFVFGPHGLSREEAMRRGVIAMLYTNQLCVEVIEISKRFDMNDNNQMA